MTTQAAVSSVKGASGGDEDEGEEEVAGVEEGTVTSIHLTESLPGIGTSIPTRERLLSIFK